MFLLTAKGKMTTSRDKEKDCVCLIHVRGKQRLACGGVHSSGNAGIWLAAIMSVKQP